MVFATPAFGKIDVLHHGGMALLEFCSKLLLLTGAKRLVSRSYPFVSNFCRIHVQ